MIRVTLDLTQREADELRSAHLTARSRPIHSMAGPVLALESAAIKLRAAIDTATAPTAP